MHRIKILLLVLGFAAVSAGSVLFGFHLLQPKTPISRMVQMPSLPAALLPSPSPSAVPKFTTNFWPSPDGKKTLVMKTLRGSSEVTTYSFFVTTSATESGKQIFSRTANRNTTLSIPFNTWSPNNQYFFIQERVGTESGALVFKTTGEAFAGTTGKTAAQPFLDIATLFKEKKSGYDLKEVTGWAAPTLLIVNTKLIGTGANGPSFWFDISRKSLIRLSTSFQ